MKKYLLACGIINIQMKITAIKLMLKKKLFFNLYISVCDKNRSSKFAIQIR